MIYVVIIMAVLAAAIPEMYGSRQYNDSPPLLEQLRRWWKRDKSLRKVLKEAQEREK